MFVCVRTLVSLGILLLGCSRRRVGHTHHRRRRLHLGEEEEGGEEEDRSEGSDIPAVPAHDPVRAADG
jgi:hypothetical protein